MFILLFLLIFVVELLIPNLFNSHSILILNVRFSLNKIVVVSIEILVGSIKYIFILNSFSV